MSVLTAFRNKLAETLADRGLSARTWASGGRHSANLLEITTAPKTTILYVKEFNVLGRPGFWGLTRNQIERIEKAGSRWFAVLLLRSSASGYVLEGNKVAECISNGAFELSKDGDFKVNEGPDLQPTEGFGSLEELLVRTL